jgi:hypothetical protein
VIDSDFQAESSVPSSDFPWPPRENGSAVDALANTWKESVFQPAQFFRRRPREFDFGWVLGYYLIIGIVAAGISLFWRMVLGPSLMDRMLPADTMQPSSPVVDFLLSPLWLLLGLFIGAGIVHLFLLMLRGAKHGFGPTVRVFCFSAGPQLFNIVPFIGPAVGGIWSLVITIIGIRETHETTTGKAVGSVLIPMTLLLILAILMFVAAALLGLGRVVG